MPFLTPNQQRQSTEGFTLGYITYSTSCVSVSVCWSVGWRRGVVVSVVHRMNEVNRRRARLVLGWVTVSGWTYDLSM